MKQFWILWNPLSGQPPRVRFDSAEEATQVAEEMARKTGGTFYVCAAEARSARAVQPVETQLLRRKRVRR